MKIEKYFFLYLSTLSILMSFSTNQKLFWSKKSLYFGNMTDLNTIVRFLDHRLKQPMPGEKAHNEMKPHMKNGAPVQIEHPTPPKEGGVMLLLYEEEGVVRFPLIQRPEYNGVHSGQIAFPGGKKELGDSDLTETALRESQEEIGVNKHHVKVIGHLSKFFVAASNFDILPVIGYAKKTPTFEPDNREVSGIITPTISDLLDEDNRRKKDIIVRGGVKLHSPYFELQQKTVWGATAMMLSEFVAILHEYRI